MFRWLIALPLVAIAVPSFSPDLLLNVSHSLLDAMFVATPPFFIAGAGFGFLRIVSRREA